MSDGVFWWSMTCFFGISLIAVAMLAVDVWLKGWRVLRSPYWVIQVVLWSAMICLNASAVIQRAEAAHLDNQIEVYIDPRPPLGMSSEQWHNSVMWALGQWFTPAGCGIKCVSDPEQAEIQFYVEEMDRCWGKASSPKSAVFPHLPRVQEKCWVKIHTTCYCSPSPDADIHQTLLHEIGHVLGLDHRPDSVMADKWPEPNRLTDRDRRSIAELKKHVQKVTRKVAF